MPQQKTYRFCLMVLAHPPWWSIIGFGVYQLPAWWFMMPYWASSIQSSTHWWKNELLNVTWMCWWSLLLIDIFKYSITISVELFECMYPWQNFKKHARCLRSFFQTWGVRTFFCFFLCILCSKINWTQQKTKWFIHPWDLIEIYVYIYTCNK